MKSTDNKIIVSANCIAPIQNLHKIAHKTINEFVFGRNFLNNLVDIDSSGRMYPMKDELCSNNNPSNIPISGAFDFEAALPSVIHEWIWLVLRHRKMPSDYIRLFQGVYKNARAIYAHNGIIINLLMFFSGVFQGCPGSKLLFNNAIDPFLTSFDKILRSENAGIARICADNKRITLSRLKHLLRIYILYIVIANHLAAWF